jgi:hypothetical protein
MIHTLKRKSGYLPVHCVGATSCCRWRRVTLPYDLSNAAVAFALGSMFLANVMWLWAKNCVLVVVEQDTWTCLLGQILLTVIVGPELWKGFQGLAGSFLAIAGIVMRFSMENAVPCKGWTTHVLHLYHHSSIRSPFLLKDYPQWYN